MKAVFSNAIFLPPDKKKEQRVYGVSRTKNSTKFMKKLIIFLMLEAPLYGMILSPPGLNEIASKEIVKVYLTGVVLLNFPDKKNNTLEITAENQPLEVIFDHVYQLCLIHDIQPNGVMFDIKPYNSDKFIRAWQLSQEMLKAL